MNIDMLSSSGHKINGPKGIGIMYAGKSVKLAPFIHGGAQERGKRAGTLNTPGIVGFGAAAELAGEKMEERKKILDGLREHLIKRVLNEIPYSRLMVRDMTDFLTMHISASVLSRVSPCSSCLI